MSVRFRSMLYAPGNQQRKIDKAFAFGADVVCIDLEDAVPFSEKAIAREQVVAALKVPRSAPFYVRVNALDTPFCLADVRGRGHSRPCRPCCAHDRERGAIADR